MTPEQIAAQKAALAQMSQGGPQINPEAAMAMSQGFRGHQPPPGQEHPQQTSPDQKTFFQSIHDALMGGQEENKPKDENEESSPKEQE